MNIPVLVEPVANNGYRASSGAPLPLSVEAATRDEALAKLREQLQVRLQNGSQLLSLEVSAQTVENPWVKFAGMFQDDPMFDEVREIIQENRKRDDSDANYL